MNPYGYQGANIIDMISHPQPSDTGEELLVRKSQQGISASWSNGEMQKGPFCADHNAQYTSQRSPCHVNISHTIDDFLRQHLTGNEGDPQMKVSSRLKFS